MAESDAATTQQVCLPQLGESVSGGTVVEWLVEPGDAIDVDDPIAEISTDKVDTEIPSPIAGTVVRHLVEVDTDVEVGDPILEVAVSGDGGAPPDQGGPGPSDPPGAVPVPATGTAAGVATPDAGPPPPPPAARGGGAPGGGSAAAAAGTPGAARGGDARPAPDGRLSPKVRRLLGEHDLEPADVRGTGSDGRITPEDVERAAAERRGGREPAGARDAAAASWRGLRLSPLVKRLLREHGLDPNAIDGTGAGDRVTPDDVRAAAARGPAEGVDQPRPARSEPAATSRSADAEAAEPAAESAAESAMPAEGDERERVEPLSRTRKVIAERMLTSLQTTAQLTAAVEADVTRLMHVRARLRDAARDRYGFAPSPLAFIAKATCRALARHPVINASIDTDAGTVTYHQPVNLGIAVDTPNGLVVPVIRDAHHLGVLALQERINDLAARARDRKLTPDDVGGGTFTITNTGSGGTLFDTPILNPPEAAILATPRIEKRPVVVTDASGNDSIAIRQRTYLCLSYDHRLIDGADAARFLTDLAFQLDDTDWDQELAELS